MVPDTRPNNPPRLGPCAMRPRTRVRRETYSSVRVRECNTHVDTCERAPSARARVGYPRQPARRPARAELTPPPSPSHRTRLSRRRDAREKTSYLLVSTTLLSHVTLRALGFENLRACGRDHDDARARVVSLSLRRRARIQRERAIVRWRAVLSSSSSSRVPFAASPAGASANELMPSALAVV